VFAVSLRPEQLYVVYTYNFLKNIEWSQKEKLETYSILVLSDNDLLKENFVLLEQKRDIGSRPITIDFKEKKPLHAYSAIFIDKAMLSRYSAIYKDVEGKETLLISVEYPDQQQIMINLTQAQSIQLGFEINRANIINQNLSISDEMILLGGTEIDVAKLYKKTRRSLEAEEERSRDLSEKITASQKEARALEERIERQNSTISEKVKELKLQEDALLQTKEKISQQEYIIDTQTRAVSEQRRQIEMLKSHITSAQDELKKITSEVALRNSEMQQQQERLQNLDRTALAKDKEIQEQNKILSKLQERIALNQNDLLLKEETISSQKGIIFVLLFFLFVIAVLIFFLVKLMRENRRQAERDFLTGLYNRRYFSQKAKKIHAKGVNKKHPITLAMIDIDHFKSVNDTYGHDIGDVVLKDIAAMLSKKFQNSELLARWGGEEFIVLSRLPKHKITDLFESLKEEVALHTITLKGHEPFHVTISIGVHYLQDNHSLEVMIEAADKLLYSAKDQGRNRVIYNS
jgi:diguanylate cyclase (GGDEF)-like protein